jgi:hypothetical protein
MEKPMHLYKRTFAAIAIAAALFSQTPAVARADGGNVQSSCYLSRTINGVSTVSTDCQEVQSQMTSDMNGLRNLFGSIVPAPVSVPVFVPEPVSEPDLEVVSVDEIDAMIATIQQVLVSSPPWFGR